MRTSPTSTHLDTRRSPRNRAPMTTTPATHLRHDRPAAAPAVDLLTQPFRARTWREVGYVLASLPIGVLTFGLAWVGLALGFGLSVTLVGIPLLMATLWTADQGARIECWRAGWVGADLHAAVPSASVVSPWWSVDGARHRLVRAAGWKRVGYFVALLPLSVVTFTVVVTSWSFGLAASTMPFWNWTVAHGCSFDPAPRLRADRCCGSGGPGRIALGDPGCSPHPRRVRRQSFRLVVADRFRDGSATGFRTSTSSGVDRLRWATPLRQDRPGRSSSASPLRSINLSRTIFAASSSETSPQGSASAERPLSATPAGGDSPADPIRTGPRRNSEALPTSSRRPPPRPTCRRP